MTWSYFDWISADWWLIVLAYIGFPFGPLAILLPLLTPTGWWEQLRLRLADRWLVPEMVAGARTARHRLGQGGEE